jgi:tetratricopeptide (TPR) repeat protein
MAKTWHNLGLALGTSQPEEAKDALARARRSFEELANHAPAEPNFRSHLAAVDSTLGNLLMAMGRPSDAAPLFCEALQLRESIAVRFPADAGHQNSLAWLLANCPVTTLRDPARAVKLAETAVDVDPKRSSSWNTLGAANFRMGQWGAAIDALEKSVILSGGGDSSDWFFLAMANWQADDKDEARECFDRAVEWMDQQKPHDAELNLLRDEAGALLRGNGSPSHEK